MKCFTARELMCGLGLNLSSNCEKDVCKMNSILEDHYLLLVDMETTKVAAWFTWEWLQTVSSVNWEDIYKVHRIVVSPTDKCCRPYCTHDLESCTSDCCTNNLWLDIHPAFWDIDVWWFVINNDKVDFNVWEWVSSWYIVYSRWPKTISSLDDPICIDPKEIRLLKSSISKSWSEMMWDFEWAAYFEQRQFKSIQQLEKIEDRLPYRIGLADMKNKHGK